MDWCWTSLCGLYSRVCSSAPLHGNDAVTLTQPLTCGPVPSSLVLARVAACWRSKPQTSQHTGTSQTPGPGTSPLSLRAAPRSMCETSTENWAVTGCRRPLRTLASRGQWRWRWSGLGLGWARSSILYHENTQKGKRKHRLGLSQHWYPGQFMSTAASNLSSAYNPRWGRLSR